MAALDERPKDERHVHVFKQDGMPWVRVSPFDVKPGDLFRLFEPEGEFVCEAIAKTPAYCLVGGVIAIECVETKSNHPPACGVPFNNTRHV